ncbi:HNH endonuclease-domain-containing protein [Tuber brumale]|nr:HNH endonuclease-domain-containing protein [Tuber brumale]
MSLNRSLVRNVSFHDAANPDVALGGLFQNGCITEANFLDILGILLVVEACLVRVQERISNHIVSRTDVPLKTGAYDIYCDSSIEVSSEPWIPRLISHTTGREDRFRDQIRTRDRKCVISGVANPDILIQSHNWSSFQAAHIFPREHESLWIKYDYGRWITDTPDSPGSCKINSCQNGFLLDTTTHHRFDQYLVSVNPDDNYKVVVFDVDICGLDGRILDPVCRNPSDPHRVSDHLLRWHFRQSVLANMRGAGEPIFEHDFPPGTDMVGEILTGPYGRERFELEIADRLREVS